MKGHRGGKAGGNKWRGGGPGASDNHNHISWIALAKTRKKRGEKTEGKKRKSQSRELKGKFQKS